MKNEEIVKGFFDDVESMLLWFHYEILKRPYTPIWFCPKDIFEESNQLRWSLRNTKLLNENEVFDSPPTSHNGQG